MESWAKNMADAMEPLLKKIALLIALIIVIILCVVFKVIEFWMGIFFIGLALYLALVLMHIKYKKERDFFYLLIEWPMILMCISSYFIYKNILISLGIAAVGLIGFFIMRKQAKAILQNKTKEAEKNIDS